MIDFRSDTITQPTEPMRQAMMAAALGDDVFGDDPTVNALERRVADLLGKEAAVFMPSGTMTNQVALRVHTEPGDEMIIEENAHIYYYEAGGPAALSGLLPRLISGHNGVFTAEQVEAVLRPVNQHYPHTKLVCIENTHNRGGGYIWPMDAIASVSRFARDRGLAMHLDGARLWNAAVASGHSEREYSDYFDTVSVCFSKGLGAPVGSALAGSTEQIARARRFRKMFGGAMRQAGLLAGAALYAIDHHRERLADDHRNAQQLARGLADVPGLVIDPQDVHTNIVMINLQSTIAAELSKALHESGVWMLPTGPRQLRAVTHLHIDSDDIQNAIAIVCDVMTKMK